MSNARFSVPVPVNEAVKGYGPGSPEKAAIKAELVRQRQSVAEIPLVIGGRHVSTGTTTPVVMPHAHRHTIAQSHKAEATHVDAAIDAAVAAREEWTRMAWEDRAAIFLKAADLLSSKYRAIMNAATMLGQSKTVYQAEIDAACELADFWRFNVRFMQELYEDQPLSPSGQWNRTECRGLEGFVLAVTPFNFTSIALNLPTSPALMGCAVVWKPAATAMASAYVGMRILEDAGLPPGVINLVAGNAAMISDKCLNHRALAGVHFTGSTPVFNALWQTIGRQIASYKSYPRLVGETGGKDFVFAHASADVPSLVTALVRGAFEYQGQKCSAASRAYIPKSLWPQLRPALAAEVAALKVGDPEDFSNFMGAVIDRKAFDSIRGYIEGARHTSGVEVIVGGECDDRDGYFIRPTVLLAEDPQYKTLCEEIFGPVLTVHVYDDRRLDEVLSLCNHTSPYALTGAIFARDRQVIRHMSDALADAAGNFYINDKPTGAVVGQQPFGGGRSSGTNDKAGSKLNLMRWLSMRTLKETFVPPTATPYAYMTEK